MPGAYGGRLSLSLRRETPDSQWREEHSSAIFWRVDFGLDLYRGSAGGFELASRAGFGLGLRLPYMAFTAEATTARSATAVTEDVARRFAFATSARFIPPEGLGPLTHLRPAIALTTPLGRQSGPVSLGIDLLLLESPL